MRRLLTGYGIGFNRRHGRRGQLFQNRYKSIICHLVAGRSFKISLKYEKEALVPKQLDTCGRGHILPFFNLRKNSIFTQNSLEQKWVIIRAL
jgi:hypothetical protein